MVVCSVAALVSLSAQSPILGEGKVSGTFYQTLPLQWAPLTPPDVEYEHKDNHLAINNLIDR